MGDIGGLQLLPSQKKRFSLGNFSGSNKLLGVGCALALLGIIFFVVFAILLGSTKKSIAVRDEEIMQIYATRDKKQETQILDFQKQLTTLRSLLGSHIVWSDGLQRVQALIQPRVAFTSFAADATARTYRFRAVADSYATVAKQIAAFYGYPGISNVALPQVGISTNGLIEFTVELAFQPEHFLLPRPSNE